MHRETLMSMPGPRSWFLLLAILFLAIAGPAHADKRVALVVGNGAYVNVPPLTNPANDAKLIAETLRSLGFTLVGGGAQLDLDESRFRRAVQDFGEQLQGADVGLFYYAGHGIQVRGANYLVPIGANPIRESDVDFQMLDSNLVLRQMDGAGTRLNVVILDACRNNPFGGRGLRATDSGLAQMRAPEGTLISFATQPNNVAFDGAEGNSPYTKALAKAIRTPGLDIFKTFNEVGLAVASATGGLQQPWVSLSPIKGDFYFAGVPAPALSESPLSSAVEARIAAIVEAALAAKPVPSNPDEASWTLLKETTDEAALKRFIERYPNSALRKDAEARIAVLEAAQAVKAAPTNSIDPHELARSLQFELKRVGCFNGAVNGEFDDATRTAWRAFAKIALIKLPDELSPETIKAVREFSKRVCPLLCPEGERAQSDRCIDIVPSPKAPANREKVERESPQKRVTRNSRPLQSAPNAGATPETGSSPGFHGGAGDSNCEQFGVGARTGVLCH
jgi:peptidoglycan hydrolase-like protein with peptidoglycan-binding domain